MLPPARRIRRTGENGLSSEIVMRIRGWNSYVGTKHGGPALLMLLVGLLFWLWPIGIGGKMPVGGDVTQFFLGLMGVLTAALREARLPVWNDLWGYGFPGIGESQMGVYYPPHLLLYGLLPTEYAYVASLLVHTFWGALGAWWAARGSASRRSAQAWRPSPMQRQGSLSSTCRIPGATPLAAGCPGLGDWPGRF